MESYTYAMGKCGPMTTFEPNALLRAQILEAIDLLINKTRVDEANTVLRRLKDQFHEKQEIFSLDSLMFGVSIVSALDKEFQSQTASLIQIRDELSGEKPFWHTYALQYNFTEFFNPEMQQAFNAMTEFLAVIEDPAKRSEQREHFKHLHEQLYEFMDEVLKPTQLSELLLGLLIHEAMQLPIFGPSDTGDTFDIADSDRNWGFSLIWPPRTMIETYTKHTQYFQKLIQQIKGEEIMYATIVISGHHSMINVR
jgi:hypothetical protein